MGLLEHSELCCEIGERAEKEFNIENMLNEMFGIWEKINFELPVYKETTHNMEIRTPNQHIICTSND